MTFEQIKQHEQAIKSHTQDQKVSLEIARIYKLTMGKDMNWKCGDCVKDAYVELLLFSRHNKIIETMNCDYVLKAGAIVRQVRKEVNGKMIIVYFNRFSITNELAELDLEQNRGAKEFYQKIPVKLSEPQKPDFIPVSNLEIDEPVVSIDEPKKKRGRKPKA